MLGRVFPRLGLAVVTSISLPWVAVQRMLCALRMRDRAATTAEYALLATLIALLIVGAVTAFGLSVEELFSADELLNALS